MSSVFDNLGFKEESSPTKGGDSSVFHKMGFKEETPDASLSPDSVLQKPEDRFRPNELLAAINGLTKGATLNLAPIGAAGLAAAMSTLKGETPVSGFGDAYRNARDDIKAKQHVLEEAYPKTTTATEFAGGVLPAMLTGGESLVPTLGNVARTEAKAGAVLGFANSPVDVSKAIAHPIDNSDALTEAGWDTLRGGATGGVTGGVVHKLLGALGPEALNSFANRRFLNSTGIRGAAYKKLVKNGTAEEVGGRLKDMGITGGFHSPEEILENARVAKGLKGQAIDNNIEQFDSSGKLSTLPDPVKMGQAVQEQLKNPLTETLSKQGYKTVAGKSAVVDNILDDIASHGNAQMSFKEAQKLKMMLKEAAFTPTGEIADKNAYRAYGIVNKEIEDAGEKTAEAIGVPGLKDEYVGNKKDYSAADIAEKASTGKVAADAVNRDLSLTDYIAGGAAAMHHGNPGIAAAALTNKAFRTYGSGLAGEVARGASKVSSGVLQGAQSLYALPKQGLQNFAKKLLSGNSTDQKLGKLLMNATERDEVGKNALLFTLMQTPTYRSLVDNYLQENSSPTEGVK